jgi:peptidoglycan hydrolase-like protein with peptidoglycan-binding domain
MTNDLHNSRRQPTPAPRGAPAGRTPRPIPRSAAPSRHVPARGIDRRPLLIVASVATVVCAVFALASRNESPLTAAAAAGALADAAAVVPDTTAAPVAADADPAATAAAPAPTSAAGAAGAAASTALPDLDGSDLTAEDSCLMDVLSVRMGATGKSVSCLQQALLDGGFYSGSVNGSFDQATFDAVERMQTDRNLYVDGIVGRESAISLGIWPDEESFVVRTPKPAEGSVDLMGYPLSSVASAGSNAPALPENSGSGRRLVYDRAGQRVWAIDGDGQIVRSWLVSGSKYSNELPGTHEVYSRSDVSTAWNGKAYLPKMVRWLKTDIGAIGFHSIPLHVEDNSPYQTEAELGTRLSGGCQRQAVRDANFLWDFAQVGTKVVVV